MSDFIYQFFLSVGLLSIISLVGGMFSAKLRQPAVIGLIFIGTIVGPNVLGIVNDNQIMELLAELGATLLLFSIGVEFAIPKIMGQGVRALLGSAIIMLALFIAGYESAVIFGLDFLTSLAIGASFSFSSTAIFVRLMQSHGLLDSAHIPFLVSVLVIEDIIAVFVMAFFASLSTSLQTVDVGAIVLSLAFSMAIMGFTYFVLNGVVSKVFRHFVHAISDENIMLLSLGLALIMAFFATALGLTAAVGAFLAGSILSNLPIRKRIQSTISPLTLAFSSYFFISIGLFVSPASLFSSIFLIFFFTTVFIVVAFTATFVSAYMIGFRSSDSVVAGASMIVMGEFSLLVAKVIAPSIKDFDLISVLAAMVFLTTILSSLFIAKRAALHFILSRLVPGQLSYAGSRLQGYVTGLITRYESSSSCVIKARTSFFIISRNAAIFITVTSAALFLRAYFLSHFPEYGLFAQIVSFLPFISVILVTPLIVSITLELRHLADALTEIFTPEGIKKANGFKSKVVISISLLVLFFFLFLSIPAAVQILQLPPVFNYLNIIPLLGLLLILWNGFRSASTIFPSQIIKSPKTPLNTSKIGLGRSNFIRNADKSFHKKPDNKPLTKL